MRRVLGLSLLLALSVGPSAQDFATLYRAAEDTRLAARNDAAHVASAYAAALRAFDAIPTQAPERGAALPTAAFAALRAGVAQRAVTLIGQSVALGGDDAVHAEVQVTALAMAEQAGAAVAAIAMWAARQPDAVERAVDAVRQQHGGALCEAADTALREGKTDAGLLTFSLLAKVSGRHPVALANLALALLHVGREAEAEAHYREAIAAAPDDHELWNDLGLLLKGLRRDQEAVAAFVKSRALETEKAPSGPATSNLVTMIRAGRAPDSAASIDAAPALAAVLARFPAAGMARHLLLRELLATPFPAGRTDSVAPKR